MSGIEVFVFDASADINKDGKDVKRHLLCAFHMSGGMSKKNADVLQSQAMLFNKGEG